MRINVRKERKGYLPTTQRKEENSWEILIHKTYNSLNLRTAIDKKK